MIIRLKGRRPGPCVLFDGHIDTVPVVPGSWTRDPYAGEIENGRLYGRGTSDMEDVLPNLKLYIVDESTGVQTSLPLDQYATVNVEGGTAGE